MKDKFATTWKVLVKAEKVLIISHKRPDGDTVGATVSMYLALKRLGKHVEMACVDDIPERYSFLPDVKRYVKEFDHEDYDVIVVMDSGASYMTKYHEIYPDIFKGKIPVINIDHHSSNDNFGKFNIVDSASASTTVILYKYFVFNDIVITPQMATALLMGIYNDTGSLMHSNTNLEVFEITGELMSLGGKVHQVAKNLYKNTPISTLKLWGRAMENVKVNDEGITVSVVTWKDFIECDAQQDEISGVVDIMNCVPGAKYICLLNEDKHGNVKGSFRTQSEDVDLDRIASKFGGGGHKKASGFTLPGRIHQETHWKIIPAVEMKNESLLPKIG